eukprot:6186142-Pleurochrysis_carterae.AAC.6
MTSNEQENQTNAANGISQRELVASESSYSKREGSNDRPVTTRPADIPHSMQCASRCACCVVRQYL